MENYKAMSAIRTSAVRRHITNVLVSSDSAAMKCMGDSGGFLLEETRAIVLEIRAA